MGVPPSLGRTLTIVRAVGMESSVAGFFFIYVDCTVSAGYAAVESRVEDISITALTILLAVLMQGEFTSLRAVEF